MNKKQSTNGSKGLKLVSSTSNAPDPLDAAREALQESRKATELLEYSADYDEDTGRTEVTVNLQQPSHPELKIDEVPASKVSPLVIVLTVARKFPAWGAVIVALAAIAAYVYLNR